MSNTDVLVLQFHRDAKFYLAANDKLNRKTTVVSTHGSAQMGAGLTVRNIYIAPDANRGKSYEALMGNLRARQTGTVTLLEPIFVDVADDEAAA